MLLSAGYEPPQQLFVHGYLLLDDKKISKSLGNVVDPLELIDIYGVDAVRYWIARAVSFGQDGTASIEGIRDRYDNELANDLGNLLSRTTAMVARYRDGRLRRGDAAPAIDLDAIGAEAASRLDRFDVTGAIDVVWDGVRALNQYVTAEAPWQLAKDEANAARLDAVLYNLVDGLTGLSVALAPFLPESAPRILAALGQGDDLSWERVRAGVAAEVAGIAAAEPLFPRIELPAEPRVIETRAHLAAPRRSDASRRARAGAGVTRISRRSSTSDDCSRAPARRWRGPPGSRASTRCLGIHPHEAGTMMPRRPSSCSNCSPIRALSLWVRRDSTTTETMRPGGAAGLFERQLSLARATREARRHPHAGRRQDTAPACSHTTAR